MSKETKSQITLPSIQEMFPVEFMQLPEWPPYAIHRTELSTRTPTSHMTNPGTKCEGAPHSPKSNNSCTRARQDTERFISIQQSSTQYRSYDSLSPSTSPVPQTLSNLDSSGSPYTSSLIDLLPYGDRRDIRDEERRHACTECGKAFNRPSSLAIHFNIHTGQQPFVCPFPGCGRRFNVNSNMRRHFRNHNSPSRPVASSPYTYPLTTIPQPLHRAASHLDMLANAESNVVSRFRASTISYPPSQCTDSEEDEELSFILRPSSPFDLDTELRQASARINRLRLRSHSSPGTRSR